MKARLLALAGLSVLSTAPLMAHHSFSAEFDFQKPITLVGTLSKMEWINPHGWIYVDVKAADGTIVTWSVEAGAPNALLRRGLRKTDFPIGQTVTVTGYLAKNGTHTANGRMVKFPDGRDFFMGSSGTGAPEVGAEAGRSAPPAGTPPAAAPR
jgi:hypothetical protein